ncbi:MAG: CHASE2 domain-containing protein [Aliidongia sp.]
MSGEERAGHRWMGTTIDGAGADVPRVTPGRVVIWLICLMVVAAAGAIPHGFFETSSNLLFDAYQRFLPQGKTPSQIVVIDIDDESLRRVGQWPWRRDRLARLIDAAAAARVVGLDILLTEPDRLSPEILLDQWPGLAPEVKAAVSALPQPDAILAKSLAAVPVVLAAAARIDGDDGPATLMATTPIFEIGIDPRAPPAALSLGRVAAAGACRGGARCRPGFLAVRTGWYHAPDSGRPRGRVHADTELRRRDAAGRHQCRPDQPEFGSAGRPRSRDR